MYRLKQFILLGGDLVMLYAGLLLALIVRYGRFPNSYEINLLSPMTVLFGAAVITAFIAGLYDLTRARNKWPFFRKILFVSGIWTLVGIVYFYLNPVNLLTPKRILILTTIIGFGLVALWRFLHNALLSTVFTIPVAFAGSAAEIMELVRLFYNEPQRGFLVLGIINPAGSIDNTSKTPVFPSLKKLSELAGKLPHLIVVDPTVGKNNGLLKEIYEHLGQQIEVVDLAHFYETSLARIPPFTFSEAWFLTNLREQQKKIYDRARLLFDYSLALVIFLFFIATFPLVALAIAATSPGPIMFKQPRVGRGGRIFYILKYRTMRSLSSDGSAEVCGPQFASENDTRITAVGKWLRRTRLDEIPQCLNILKGNMTLIGPRPERPEFVAKLTEHMPFYPLRHIIKPGLTGWAQVHAAYYGTISENLRKLEYDLYYLKNRGPLLDLTIIARTIAILARLAGR